MAWLKIPDMEHVGIPSRPSRWRKNCRFASICSQETDWKPQDLAGFSMFLAKLDNISPT